MSHHDHSHDHAHGHSHAPADFGRAFAIGIALNTAFVVIEGLFGFFANSVALLADAGHNLSDVLGLVVAWVAAELAKRAPTTRFTYGLGGSSILAALFNSMLLLVAVGAIGWEAILRLMHPEPVGETVVIVVAIIGILVNGITAWLFVSGRKGDLNIRGAFLHMAADAAVSAGVVIAGFAILLTGWQWLDPLVSLAIVAVILASTWGLLRDSVAMTLSAVPAEIEPAAVRGALPARRKRAARPPHLADEHDGDFHDGASGHAGRAPRRHVPDERGARDAGSFRHRPRDAAGRDERRHCLRAGARRRGVSAGARRAGQDRTHSRRAALSYSGEQVRMPSPARVQ
jgi:cobalt-zinc-cadmium efflux system protein